VKRSDYFGRELGRWGMEVTGKPSKNLVVNRSPTPRKGAPQRVDVVAVRRCCCCSALLVVRCATAHSEEELAHRAAWWTGAESQADAKSYAVNLNSTVLDKERGSLRSTDSGSVLCAYLYCALRELGGRVRLKPWHTAWGTD
jgi:hypothetical protein